MEISDEKERRKALFELIKKDPENSEAVNAYIGQNDKSYRKMLTLTLTDEFKAAQKQEHLELLKEKNCKFVQYRYGTSNPESLESYSALYYHDDNNRIIYAPEIFNYSMSSQGTEHFVTFHYDENGRWISTDRYDVYGSDKRTDKAVYDDQGRLIKIYMGDFLAYEYKYNEDGYCVRTKNNYWDVVYDYEYNDQGYLVKITKNEDGVKSNITPGMNTRIEYDKDSRGMWDQGVYYNPNYLLHENVGAKELPEDFFEDPRDYSDGTCLISLDEVKGTENLTIAVTKDYGDGFRSIAIYRTDNRYYKSFLKSFSLYYLPE